MLLIPLQEPVRWRRTNGDWSCLGKLADVIAGDISLGADGNQVILRSGGKGSEAIRLTSQPGTICEIAINNARHAPMAATAPNDFSFWYDAFQDATGRRFELRNVIEVRWRQLAVSTPRRPARTLHPYSF